MVMNMTKKGEWRTGLCVGLAVGLIVWLLFAGDCFYIGIAEAGTVRTITLQSPSVSNVSDKLDYGYAVVAAYKVTLQRLEVSSGNGNWTAIADGAVTVDVTDGATGAQLRQWTARRELPAGTYRRYRVTLDAAVDYKAAVKAKGSTRWWVTGNAGLGSAGDLIQAVNNSLMSTVRWTVTAADLADSPAVETRTVGAGMLAFEGVLAMPLIVVANQDVSVCLTMDLDKALVGRMTPWNGPGLAPVPRVRVQ